MIKELLILFSILVAIAMIGSAAATPSVNLKITSTDTGREIRYGTPGDFNIYITPTCDCAIDIWAPLSYISRGLQGEKAITVFEKKGTKWVSIKKGVLTPSYIKKNINPINMKKNHRYLIELKNKTSYDTKIKIKSTS